MKYSNEILHNLLYFMNNKTDAVFSFLILYIFTFSLMSAMVYVDTPLTNSYEKKSTAEMLLILTILNVISKQNTTNRVEKNDLV